MIARVDIGYGYTKAVCGEMRVVFPSVVGKAERIRYETELHCQLVGGHVSDGRGMVLITKEGDRFVGELALLQSSVQWTLLDRSRVKDPLARLLFFAPLSGVADADEKTKFKFLLQSGLECGILEQMF